MSYSARIFPYKILQIKLEKATRHAENNYYLNFRSLLIQEFQLEDNKLTHKHTKLIVVSRSSNKQNDPFLMSSNEIYLLEGSLSKVLIERNELTAQ